MGRPRRIAVVGAGWAGLAAAIELSAAGCQVTLVDAAPACGGRARGITASWQGRLPTDAAPEADQAIAKPLAFDNGQHLVIGAYSTLLSLLGRIGVTEGQVFTRHRFRLDDGQGLSIPGPGLIGMLRARGLAWSLRFALIKALAGIALHRERALARARGQSVLDWSRAQGQPPALLEQFWRPLVISTMNTPVDEACAETFVRVLADSVAGAARASDLLIPHETLSSAFVEPALTWLRARAVIVLQGADVRAIGRGPDHRYPGNDPDIDHDRHNDAAGKAGAARASEPGPLQLLVGRESTPLALAGHTTGFDGVVLATPPGNAARILGRSRSLIAAPGLIADLEAFDYRPISTVYLGWSAADLVGSTPRPADDRWSRLPEMTLLHDDAARSQFGQWLFRRPDQDGWRIAAVVVSDSAMAMALPREQLAAVTSRQLTEALGLPPAAVYAVFHDRRATIAAVSDRPRIEPTGTGIAGLSLAGDYQYYRYPATLESALRSGSESARALLATLPAR